MNELDVTDNEVMAAEKGMPFSAPSEDGDRTDIPWDLTLWVNRAKLAEWTAEVVGTLGWNSPNVEDYLRSRPNYHPRQWLNLLTFAYLTRIYGSEEIVDQCYADPQFRELSAGEPPRHRSLATFRRENRGLIKWCMVQVLRRALQERFSLGPDLLPAAVRARLAEAATTRLDIARHLDRSAEGS